MDVSPLMDVAEIQERALPASDRQTFNYGRALGIPKGQDHAEYRAYERYNAALRAILSSLSREQWSLEMALRNVYQSETRSEQAVNMLALRVTFLKTDRTTETLASGPIKFFRYGRIGNVLRRFVPSWTSAHNR